MRPAGEVRQAILQAADALIEEIRQASKTTEAAARKGPTLVEIAARASVGYKAARMCLGNCTRAGALEIVGAYRVARRGRPAAEYARPARADLVDQAQASGAAVLGSTLQAWTR